MTYSVPNQTMLTVGGFMFAIGVALFIGSRSPERWAGFGLMIGGLITIGIAHLVGGQ